MGIFDKFKKKKTNTAEPVAEVKSDAEEKTSDVPEIEIANTPGRKSAYTKVNIGDDSSVHELWSIYNKESGKSDSFNIFEFMVSVIEEINNLDPSDDNNYVETEFMKFSHEILKACDKTVSKIKSEKRAAEKEPEKKLQVTPVNAEPIFYMTKNKLRMWMIILPPVYGGDGMDVQSIRFQLDSLGIKYGVDNDTLDKILSGKIYMKAIQVAVGKEAVHGISGTCTNIFSKQVDHVNIKEDMHGNVNYKELNMIQSVHQGDVICEITLPTEAVDGMTVTGETIVGREGKYPSVPAGKNTEFNSDKTLLIAKIDGEVVFEDNKFHVRNLLTIGSDVDNAVGNIDFTGDVLIRGDVREGYTVKAEGDVHITGTVEGATVIVGGDLQIDRGMTGGNKGRIEVQGKLKCKYLENCRVYAKEGVEADQLIYCTLSTDKNIVLKGKKGSVTGGKLVAGGTIEAVTIGAISSTTIKTDVVLGVIPHLAELEKELKQRLEASQDQLVKLTQDITYIQNNIKNVKEDRKELLKKLLFQYQVDQRNNKKLEAELNEVSEKIQANTEQCGLKCNHVYPIINLNVCGVTQVINREITDCRIVRKDNKAYVSGSNLENMIIF